MFRGERYDGPARAATGWPAPRRLPPVEAAVETRSGVAGTIRAPCWGAQSGNPVCDYILGVGKFTVAVALMSGAALASGTGIVAGRLDRNPVDLLRAAAAATEGEGSAVVSESVTEGRTRLTRRGVVSFAKALGRVDTTDSAGTSSEIVVGSFAYVTTPSLRLLGGKPWFRGSALGSRVDDFRLLPWAAAGAVRARFVGIGRIAGKPHRRYEAVLEAQRAAANAPEAVRTKVLISVRRLLIGDHGDVELWIDGKNRIHRISATVPPGRVYTEVIGKEKVTLRTVARSVTRVDYADFGVAVVVKPPAADQVETFP